MKFDYQEGTKSHYQSDAVAETYHSAFAKSYGLRNARFRIVANGERNSVKKLLQEVAHDKILDIPAGTGKLAVIFSELGAVVTSCDISQNMLDIAKQEYAKIGYGKNVKFSVQDAANLSSMGNLQYDAVVCLRLMHRVPAKIRVKILEEISRMAPHAIISFGIESPFHVVRRFLRALLLGGGKDKLCYVDLRTATREISQQFVIKRHLRVVPFMSQEVVFLLESKGATGLDADR
jgi:ubiquinone/menaquinone biosynthesis C-methylase UbiE